MRLKACDPVALFLAFSPGVDPLLSASLQNRLARLVSLFDQGGTVYLITCLASGPDEGKGYIGLTTQPLWLREYGHLISTDHAKSSEPLYEAMRKHHPPDKFFKWEIIGRASTWEELRELERATIRERGTHVSLGRGFNLTWGGEGLPPLKRLTARVENKIFRQRCGLENGNKHARKDFAKRYTKKWNALNEPERTQRLEHNAIRSQFAEVFREYGLASFLKSASEISDPAITDAVEMILREEPELATAELTEYLRVAPHKPWVEKEG